MRILLLLLIAGLCLVTAKYIPFESSDTNSVLNRVRRSDSDSNTASAERDDDSSNENDNDDGDDNDSIDKKIKEEQAKLREKEEKKKQKLLEKLEKEKQKGIEEKNKLEEKFAKEKLAVEKRKEKEERKLAEKTEKENRKREEEKRKAEEKLEKEERKRQEKLKKQLEKIQNEQIESAEDSYLETEEEDSVEIEGIWKVHVYNKYGLSITSTKLERQAAIQRYLQEEMGINANSTKSERRQAIVKLIETKLYNDSAAVDSFRNLLVSHVNAVQIQKLRTKLENDLDELDNQTALLSNISLPWASTAQQNIEEKRTFLQAVAQFLSNIVPNWFGGGQSSSSTNLPCNVSNGENNLNVLPGNISTGSSSSKPSNANGPLVSAGNSANVDSPVPLHPGLSTSSPSESNLPGNINSSNNVSISEAQVNGLPSNTENSVNTDSSKAPAPEGSELSISGSTETNSPGVSNSLNNNVSHGETNVNGLPSDSLGNSESSNTPVQTNFGSPSSNPSEPNEGSDSVINNTGNKVNSDSTSGPALEISGSPLGNPSEHSGSFNSPVDQNDANALALNTPDSANGDTSNAPIPPSGPGTSTTNPSDPNLGEDNSSLYDNTPVKDISKIPLNSESSSIAAPLDSGFQSSNSTEFSGNDASFNNNVPVTELTTGNSLEPNAAANSSSLNNISVSQKNGNGLPSNTDNLVNADDASTAQSDIGQSTSNPSKPNLTEASHSLNNIVPVSETNISELVSSNKLNNPADQSEVNGQSLPAGNSAKLDLSTQPAIIPAGSSPSNQIENNETIDISSLNNKIPASQTDDNRLSSSIDNLSNIDSPNSPSSTDFVSASSNLSDVNGSVGSDSIDSNISTDIKRLNSNTGELTTSDSPNTAASVAPASTADNKLESNDFLDSSLNNVAHVNEISESPFNTGNSANVDSSIVSAPLASLSNLLNDNTAVSANLTNNSSPNSDVTNDESSNSTLSTVSEQTLDNLSSTVVANNTSVDNTVSVSSSTYVDQNGLNNNGNIIELSSSGNDNNIPKDGIVSAVNIDEAAQDSNVSPLSNDGSAQGTSSLVIEGNNGSTIEDKELVGTTTIPVEDSLIQTGTETVSSDSDSTKLSIVSATENTNTYVPIVNEATSDSSTVFNLANSNGNEVIYSVTTENVDLSGSDLNLEVKNGLVPLSPETGINDVTANNQAIKNDSISQDTTSINVESTTANVGDYVIVKDQNIGSIISSVAESNGVVTEVEPRTEQDVLVVQEIMNTPNDFVTVTSVQPYQDVNVPNEAAATVVDVKLQ